MTDGDLRKGPNPRTMAITNRNSSTAWPVMRSGPALKPMRADSATVTVKSGPGIRTPERARVKDPPKMAASSNKLIPHSFDDFGEDSNIHFIVSSFFLLQCLLARLDEPDEFNYPVNQHPGR